MDRAQIVARLARLNGYLSEADEAALVSRCHTASANSPDVVPESVAFNAGLLSQSQVAQIRAQLGLSRYICDGCQWTGTGRELAVIGNRVICKNCRNEAIRLAEPAPAGDAAATPAGGADAIAAGQPTIDDPGRAGLTELGAPAGQSVDDLRPGTEIDGCRIEARIGAGAVGVVYRAVDIRLDRPVAIKILSADLMSNRNHVLRFEQEARVLARLEHPNVVQVYRLGEIDRRPYLIMQWVDGESIARRMQIRRAPLPVEQAVDVLIQSASGLGAAHAHGIIHRDVKPDNLLITRDGILKVADFGLAKPQEGGATISRAGAFMGTPAYVAPEQINAETVTAQTDVYSLGITGYQLLTGRLPFKAEKLTDLFYHHANTPLPFATELVPSIPAALSAFLQQMAAKRPDVRPPSMADVVAELQQLVPGAGPGFPLMGSSGTYPLPAAGSGALPAVVNPEAAMHTQVASSGRMGHASPPLPPPVPGSVTLDATRATTRKGSRPRHSGGGGSWLWLVLALVLIGAGVAIQQYGWPSFGGADGKGGGGGVFGWGGSSSDDDDPDSAIPARMPSFVLVPELDVVPMAPDAIRPRLIGSVQAAGPITGMACSTYGHRVMAVSARGVTWFDALDRTNTGTFHSGRDLPEAIDVFPGNDHQLAVVATANELIWYTGDGTGYEGKEVVRLANLDGGRQFPGNGDNPQMLLRITDGAGVHARVSRDRVDLNRMEFPGMRHGTMRDAYVMPDGVTVAVVFHDPALGTRLGLYRTTPVSLMPLRLGCVVGGRPTMPGAEGWIAGPRVVDSGSVPAPVAVFGATADSRYLDGQTNATRHVGSRHLLVGVGQPRNPDDLSDQHDLATCIGVRLLRADKDVHWIDAQSVWAREFTDEVVDASITPLGECVVVALKNGEVHVLDGRNGEPLVDAFRPAGTFAPPLPIRLLAAPVGTRLYLAVNRQVRIYELAPE